MFFSQSAEGKRMSRPAVRVAVAGIAVGFIVMLLTIAIAMGFKQEIRNKVIGFGSHIQVVNFDNNNTYQMRPIYASDSLVDALEEIPYVTAAERFCTKPGIIKTDNAFQGIIIKGRESHGHDFFEQQIVEGRMPEKNNEVLVSQSLAQMLQLQTDAPLYCYFIDDNVRVRKYTIVGRYDTRFSDYDDLFIIATMPEVQHLCGWKGNEVCGIEIRLSDFNYLYEAADQVYNITANRPDALGNFHYTQTVEQLNPAIFSWLQLLDMNVVIIIILMMCVSAICMISGLIILILDNVQMIGLMKALGATDRMLRKTFLYEAFFLIGKGMIWGNFIGAGLCWLQSTFHLIPLDSATYYISYVPIAFSIGAWVILNIVTLLLSMLVVLGPSAIVSRISPAKVMHFE